MIKEVVGLARAGFHWFFNGSEQKAQEAAGQPPEQFVSANGSRPPGAGGTVYRSEQMSAMDERAQARHAAAVDEQAYPTGPPQQRHAPQQPAPPQRPPAPGLWQPPVVGPPIEDFAPRPSMASAYRPDYIADGWSTPHFTVRAASVRGYSHRASGEPRQDDVAVAWHRPTGAVLFAVADGVSDAPLSHIGATSVCRAAIGAMTAGLDAPGQQVDWAGLLKNAAWQLCEQARLSLGLPEINKTAAEEQMATTLVAGLVVPSRDGPQVQLVQVGDSSAWLLNSRAPGFQCLTPTKFRVGEEVFSNAVVALPRVPPVDVKSGTISPEEVLLVGTDGFGDPLGDGRNAVGVHFAAALAVPPPALKFANDLDFSRETWDDDRTLFALWPYRIEV